MMKLDCYWMCNDDWWEYDDNDVEVIKPDAPPEAQESYKHYLEQVERGSKTGAL